MQKQTPSDRYQELKEKYKIAKSMYGLLPPEILQNNNKELIQEALAKVLAKFDIVLECVDRGQEHMKYRVVKNAPELPTSELALICNEGSSYFGCLEDDGLICIYVD